MLTISVDAAKGTAAATFECEIDMSHQLRTEPVLDGRGKPVPGQFRRVMADPDIEASAVRLAAAQFAKEVAAHAMTGEALTAAHDELAARAAELKSHAANRPAVSIREIP